MAQLKPAPAPSPSRRRQKPFRFKGIAFLGVVLLLYGAAFVYDADRAAVSIESAGDVLAALVPVLAVVVLLTAGINHFLRPEAMARHLGEEARWRGWVIALAAGVISHGSMYVWYPLIQDVRRQGARDGLIVAFFYARAVKLALLPMLAAYFGLTFAVTLTILTLAAAWIQGLIMDRITARTPRNDPHDMC